MIGVPADNLKQVRELAVRADQCKTWTEVIAGPHRRTFQRRGEYEREDSIPTS